MSVIIKDIRRNDREVIRIEISEFKGRELINLRIWYQAIDERGNVVYKPTQKGVALDVSNYAELLDGVERIGNFLKDREAGVNPLGE